MPGFAGAVFSRVQDLQDYSGSLEAGRFLRYDDATGTFKLGDFNTHGTGQSILKVVHNYSNADFPSPSASIPDFGPIELSHTNLADTANILSPFDLIYTGFRGSIVYGSATVNARGTEQALTLTCDVQGSASANNELALLMGWMRAKPASGTPADGVASMWYTDWSLHGNIGAQSSLLNGITMIVNSYDSAQPSRGPSAAQWLVTKPDQGGGREDGHNAAPTYPLDFMLGILAWSGTGDELTKRRGAQVGIGVGEWGSGWGQVQDDEESWFAHGVSIRGGELSALRIRDPHPDASSAMVGSAILFDAVQTPGRSWNWWMDAGSADAPTVGAIRLHGTNGSTAGRIQWGATNAPALWRSANSTLHLSGVWDALLDDAATNAVSRIATWGHNTSGTAAASFGSEERWQLESSTTADTDAASLIVSWATATHGSRKARLALGVYDTAYREGIRIDTSGSLARVTLGDGATSGTARLYVRDDSNAEVATFESASALASVFLKLGDGTGGAAAALRIYPQVNASSGATLIQTGGVILRGRYWTGSASADVDGQWALRMLTTAPTYAMVGTVGSFDNLFLDQAGRVTVGTANLTTGLFNVLLSDSATATSSVLNCFNHRSTGTPAAGFGGETRWRLHSSTTTDQDAASVTVSWATATHASRKAQMSWSVYDTAAREALRLVTDGATAQVQFAAGTALLPGLAPLGDPNTGIYNVGADELGFATAGTHRAKFNAAGNLVLASNQRIYSFAGLDEATFPQYVNLLGYQHFGSLADNMEGLHLLLNLFHTNASANTVYGARCEANFVTTTVSAAAAGLVGGSFLGSFQGTGASQNLSLLGGGEFIAQATSVAGAGTTIGLIAAGQFTAHATGQNMAITTLTAVEAMSPNALGAGTTITNNVGVLVHDRAGRGSTVNAGIRIEAQTGSNAWAILSEGGTVELQTGIATNIGLIVKGFASQSANRQEWKDSTGAVDSTVSENGYFTTRRTSAPADAELVAGELAFWLDATNGACKAMFKAKQADGTVRTGSVALA